MRGDGKEVYREGSAPNSRCGKQDNPRRTVMIKNGKTHTPANRTFAVIDGRLNFKSGSFDATKRAETQAMRSRHYTYMTEKAYVGWIKRFIFFHGKRQPIDMAEPEIAKVLSSLATDSKVSASTQNQALYAILFLYQKVLQWKIGFVDGVVRAQRPKRLPVVLTREEMRTILRDMNDTPWLDGNAALRCWP
jgi:integrase